MIETLWIVFGLVNDMEQLRVTILAGLGLAVALCL